MTLIRRSGLLVAYTTRSDIKEKRELIAISLSGISS